MRILFQRLDERLGIKPLIKTLRRTRPSGYLSPLQAPPISPGRIALILVIFLFLSGLGLTFFYNPTAEGAASSIANLHEDHPLGWLLRNVHRWSAFLLFGFVILHALRVWLARAYTYPRDLNWWVGIFLLLLVIALGGTGYLLRWDIKAFSLMDLVINSLSHLPFLGSFLVALILGGVGDNVVPLYRGYATHIWFFPLILVALLITHLLVVWRQGLAEIPRFWKKITEGIKTWKWANLLPGIALLVVLLSLSAITPQPAQQPSPTESSPWPHPDWLLMFYFLPFWFFQGNLRVVGVLIFPLAILGFLFLTPRLAKWSEKRTLKIVMALVGVIGVVWLLSQMGVMGVQVPLQGCSACHRSTIIGGAPTQLSEFEIRDPDWVVFHLQEPVESILKPYPPPQQMP